MSAAFRAKHDLKNVEIRRENVKGKELAYMVSALFYGVKKRKERKQCTCLLLYFKSLLLVA